MEKRKFFVKLLWENKVLLKTSTFEIIDFASIFTTSDRQILADIQTLVNNMWDLDRK